MKNFASFKDEIEEIVEPILKKNNLKIYEILNYFDFESDIIQILVEDLHNPSKPLDFDDIVKSNEEISTALDDLSQLSEPYMLEVASAGVEKPIKTIESLRNAINSFIRIELKEQHNGNSVIEGILSMYKEQDKSFEISYFVKGQKKKYSFKFEDVKNIRYAVKF